MSRFENTSRLLSHMHTINQNISKRIKTNYKLLLSIFYCVFLREKEKKSFVFILI